MHVTFSTQPARDSDHCFRSVCFLRVGQKQFASRQPVPLRAILPFTNGPQSPRDSRAGGEFISLGKPATTAAKQIERLLAEAPLVRNSCDLDLLLFLHRHPRTLLTSEQIAAFVGYSMNQIADSLDTFIASGLLGRIQNAKHAARMYFLKLDGPPGHGPKRLLELASTRLGRQSIIRTLRSERHSDESSPPQGKLRLLKIA